MDVYVGFFTGKGRGRKSERERERETKENGGKIRAEGRNRAFLSSSIHLFTGKNFNLHNFGKVNPSKFPWIPLIGTRRIGGSSFAIVARARMRERADKRIVRFFVQTPESGTSSRDKFRPTIFDDIYLFRN